MDHRDLEGRGERGITINMFMFVTGTSEVTYLRSYHELEARAGEKSKFEAVRTSTCSTSVSKY